MTTYDFSKEIRKNSLGYFFLQLLLVLAFGSLYWYKSLTYRPSILYQAGGNQIHTTNYGNILLLILILFLCFVLPYLVDNLIYKNLTVILDEEKVKIIKKGHEYTFRYDEITSITTMSRGVMPGDYKYFPPVWYKFMIGEQVVAELPYQGGWTDFLMPSHLGAQKKLNDVIKNITEKCGLKRSKQADGYSLYIKG